MASIFDSEPGDAEDSMEASAEGDDGMEAIAEELLMAFESKDVAALASILRSLKS